MSVVTLAFDMPVYVDVDLDAGEVDRVTMDDQSADYGALRSVDGLGRHEAEYVAAVDVALEAEWPSWDWV